MKQRSFDHIIKEKALGHEAPVPSDAWNNIVKQKKKRRYGAFWWLPLLLLLGLGTYGVYRYQSPAGGNDKQQLAQREKSIQQEAGQLTNENPSSQQSSSNDHDKDNNRQYDLTATGNWGDNSKASTGNTDPVQKTGTGSATIKKIPAIKPGNNIPQQGMKNTDVNNSIFNEASNKASGKGARKIRKHRSQAVTQLQDDDGSLMDDITGKTTRKKSRKKTAGDGWWTGKRKKGTGKAVTKMTITAPGMEEHKEDMPGEDNEWVVTAVPATSNPDSSMIAKQTPSTKKDSTLTKDTAAVAVLLPEKPKEKKKGTIFVDISAMPFLPLQQNARLLSIQRNSTGFMTTTEYHADDIQSHADPAVSFNIALRFRTGKKTCLGAGLQYARIKETVRLSGKETTTTYTIVKRLNSTGTALVDDTVSSTATGKRIINAVNSYDMVSVPVFIQYRLWEHAGWCLSFNGGLNFNISTDYKNSISGSLVADYAGSQKKRAGDKQFTADIFAGLRLGRNWGSHVQLFAEPVLQLNMIRYRMPDMINYKYLHRAGLNVGLSFRLGR